MLWEQQRAMRLRNRIKQEQGRVQRRQRIRYMKSLRDVRKRVQANVEQQRKMYVC